MKAAILLILIANIQHILADKADDEACTANSECNSQCCITRENNARTCGEFFAKNTNGCVPKETALDSHGLVID